MTAKEWKDSFYGDSISEHTVQSILDDGRVQGMREAAEFMSLWAGEYYANAIRHHADKLAKGEK